MNNSDKDVIFEKNLEKFKDFNLLDKTQLASSLPLNRDSNKEEIKPANFLSYKGNELVATNPRLEAIFNTNLNIVEYLEIDNIIPDQDINSIIKFDKDDEIKKSFSLVADDYLPIDNYNFSGINEEFEKFVTKYDKKDLGDLRKQIEKSKIDLNANKFKIGPVSSLDYLIETSFNSDQSRKKSIIENFISLEDLVFRWRRVGGDGNCFYRAVIFAYLENIILEKNIPLLQYVILEIHKKFFTEEHLIQKLNYENIKRELVIKILILIYFILKTENDVMTTYDFFLRCFNNCRAFDIGLIFYLRFKLYEFIKDNEDKLYTPNFSVKIGNLLPNEYETDKGEFLYKKFYEDYLMRLYKDAEKIVIYLTPFVLKVNLQILIYDFGRNNIEKLKTFPFPAESNNTFIPTLTLLYKQTHYDLIYEEKYFRKHMKYLTLFVNITENLRIFNSELTNEINKKKKEYEDLGLNKDKNLNQNLLLPDQDNEEIKKFENSGNNKININVATQINNIHENSSESVNNFDQMIQIMPKLKCSHCKKDYIPYQTKVKLCKDCLSNEIKSVILSKYLEFLQVSKDNFMDKKESHESKKLFNSYFSDQSSGHLINESITIHESFKLIDKNLNDFINRDIKSNLCAICENPINTKTSTLSYFILPCQCIICSPRCIKAYFGILFSAKRSERGKNKEIFCICSADYNTNELKKLLYFCHSNNMKKSKGKILELFREKILNQCMVCLQDLEEKEIYNCEMKDVEIEQILNLKNFNHIMCAKCYGDQLSGGKEIPNSQKNEMKVYNQHQYCMICNSVHILLGCKVENGNWDKLKCNNECKIL